MSDLEKILSDEPLEDEVFDDEPTEEVAEAAETETEIETEEVEGEQPEAVEAEEKPAEPEPVAEETPAMVPLAALQKVRAEMHDLKQLIPAAQPKPAPDFYEDPNAAVEHSIAPVRNDILTTKLEMSRFLAEREYGKEAVDEAFEYFNQHPEQSATLLKSPSPFHAAMDYYTQQKVVSEIGSDPDGWREQQRAAIRQEVEAEFNAKMVAENVAQQRAPSLAKGTNLGSRNAPPEDFGPLSIEDILKG